MTMIDVTYQRRDHAHVSIENANAVRAVVAPSLVPVSRDIRCQTSDAGRPRCPALHWWLRATIHLKDPQLAAEAHTMQLIAVQN